MSRKWKWTRVSPGHYVCGPWAVIGERTTWELQLHGDLVEENIKSKSLAQDMAEERGNGKMDVDTAPPPRKSDDTSTIDNSTIHSLRLSVETLAIQVGLLSEQIRKMRKGQ